MKTSNIILSVLAILIVVGVGAWAYRAYENRSGNLTNNTTSTTPTGSTDNSSSTASSTVFITQKGNSDIIRVSKPQANDLAASPLAVEGEARGNWYFEASFPVKLLDGTGKEIGHSTAQAQKDWMTSNYVPFKASITFMNPTTATGTLVLAKDNPSGLPQNADELRIPVRFNPANQASVEVFMSNSRRDPQGLNCSTTYPSSRTIARTAAPAGAAIQELLKGPTLAEKDQGFLTNIPVGTKLNSLNIASGTARADFNSVLNTAAGSCKVSAIRSQITNTLKQFPTVQNVIILVNGQAANVLQP